MQAEHGTRMIAAQCGSTPQVRPSGREAPTARRSSRCSSCPPACLVRGPFPGATCVAAAAAARAPALPYPNGKVVRAGCKPLSRGVPAHVPYGALVALGPRACVRQCRLCHIIKPLCSNYLTLSLSRRTPCSRGIGPPRLCGTVCATDTYNVSHQDQVPSYNVTALVLDWYIYNVSTAHSKAMPSRWNRWAGLNPFTERKVGRRALECIPTAPSTGTLHTVVHTAQLPAWVPRPTYPAP